MYICTNHAERNVDGLQRCLSNCIIRFQGNMNQVLAVSFSPFDSRKFVTCGKQHQVTFWELEDNKLKQSRGRMSVSYRHFFSFGTLALCELLHPYSKDLKIQASKPGLAPLFVALPGNYIVG